VKAAYLTLATTLLGAGLYSGPVLSQGLKAVRPLDGYKCMVLNLTEEQMVSSTAGPAIYAEPSRSASVLGNASAIVITADPIRKANGYTAVLTLSGKPGWVESDKLAAYSSVTNPSARCVPSVMSNGRYGFAFPH